MKKIILFIVSIMFFIALISCSNINIATSNNSYIKDIEFAPNDTPNETVEAFFEAINANDYNTLISLLPIKQMAEGYDGYVMYKMPKNLQKLTGYPVMASNNNDMYDEMNIDICRGKFAEQIKLFYIGLLFDDSYSDFVDQAEQHLQREITVLRVDEQKHVKGLEEVNFYKEFSGVYKADDMTERAALIEYNDQTFLMEFTLIQYKNGWGIESIRTSYCQTRVSQVIAPISEKAYISALNDGMFLEYPSAGMGARYEYGQGVTN
jgi:hypothetical protein